MSAALLLSSVPASVYGAADSDAVVGETLTDVYSLHVPAAGLGTDLLTNPEQSGGEWSGTEVYFGMMSRYPILFRVLDKANNDYGSETVLLDADNALFRGRYNEAGGGDWESSDMRMYLNEDFLLGNFSESARNALAASTGNGLTGDKIFMLSKEEASNSAYGYGTSAARVKSNLKLNTDNSAAWYLRTASSDGSSVETVSTDGGEATASTSDYSWVSPAINLKPESIVMTWPADEYKPNAFSVVDATPDNKLILTITGGSGFSAERTDSGTVPAGSSFTVNVKDLGTTDWNVAYTQISAILTDQDRNVIAYGPVSEVVGTGDVEVRIPSGVPDGDYTVKLFAEDINSTWIQHATDIASNIIDIPVNVGNTEELLSQTTANPEETSKSNTEEAAAAAASSSSASSSAQRVQPVPAAATAHKITVNADKNGKAAANVASATAGTLVQITATANAGYHLKSWTSKQVQVAADGTFTMPNQDVTINVVFEADSPTQYKVNVAASNGGTVTASKSTAAAGERVDISAKANNGWTFTGWNIPDVATDPEGKYFLMPAHDVTINAIFVQNATLTLQTDGNGTASANPSNPVPGQTVTLTAKAYSGYHFKEWVSTDVNVGTSNQFVMPEKNVTIQATFEADAPTTYTVTTVTSGSSADFGTISLPYGTVYQKGDTVWVDVGFSGVGVQCTALYLTTADGKKKNLDPSGDYFTMPSSNVVVTAVFEPFGNPDPDPDPAPDPTTDPDSIPDSDTDQG